MVGHDAPGALAVDLAVVAHRVQSISTRAARARASASARRTFRSPAASDRIGIPRRPSETGDSPPRPARRRRMPIDAKTENIKAVLSYAPGVWIIQCSSHDQLAQRSVVPNHCNLDHSSPTLLLTRETIDFALILQGDRHRSLYYTTDGAKGR